MKVLIVEDKDALVQEYLRIIRRLVPDEEISFTSVPSLSNTCFALEDQWDVILMDDYLGKPIPHPRDENVRVSNGADLIRIRRSLEDSPEGPRKAFILGISATHVGQRLLDEAGADESTLKLYIPRMAEVIKQQQQRKAQA